MSDSSWDMEGEECETKKMSDSSWDMKGEECETKKMSDSSWDMKGSISRRRANYQACKQKAESQPAVCCSEKGLLKNNPFSEPWEDSDLVLMVRFQRFHVHRLVLILNSPVFKGMLKSGFKEARSEEITLPEKDPVAVLDLLTLLYPQLRGEISMKNVEYILKLADEYQITSVMDLCSNFLKIERKTKSNAMTILLLAQKYKLNSVAEDCHDLLAKMSLENLESYDEFEELDGHGMRKILLPRMRKLEKVVTDLKPQVEWLLAYATWLCSVVDKDMPWCPVHHRSGKSEGSLNARLRGCEACRNVIRCLVSKTHSRTMTAFEGLTSRRVQGVKSWQEDAYQVIHTKHLHTMSDSECTTNNILPVLEEMFALKDGE